MKGEEDFAAGVKHKGLFGDEKEEDEEVGIVEMGESGLDITEVGIDDPGDDDEGNDREDVGPGDFWFF